MILLPKYLYKFRTFNQYTSDILEDLRLYMALPKEFNDPFEGQLVTINSGTAGNGINLAAGKFNRDARNYLNTYRVLSLGSNIRSKSMWAYYAGDYSGFAIQFNTKHNFSKAQRIIYRSNNEDSYTIPINGPKEVKKVIRHSLLYKSDDWVREEEFRIINTASRKYFHFTMQDIESIILGCNVDIENEHHIATFCKEHNVRLRHMWLVPRKSTIEFYTDTMPRFDGTPYRNYIDHDL